MAFTRPTLAQLIERTATDLETRLPGTDPRLRRSMAGAFMRALAGVSHGLHGHLDFIARQILPTTADADYLDEHADIWGITRLAATAAIGTITFTGTTGSIVPAGTIVQRADGLQYATEAEVTIDAGAAQASVTANTGGQSTNAIAGTKLNLLSPIAGVNSQAIVDAGGLTGGTDTETDEALRARIVQRVRAAPQGGAMADYETWALAVAGNTRVWVFPAWNGLGTVGVYFVRDSDASIIPDAAEVATTQAYIDTRRPVTAAVTVYAPTAVPVDMTISLQPNTSTVQTAVAAELADLFGGTDVEDGTGTGTLLLSHINEAISRAAGEIDHVLVSPVADVTCGPGQILTLGAITFQAL